MTTRTLADSPPASTAGVALGQRPHPALIALLGGFVALVGLAEAPSVHAQSPSAWPLQFTSAPIPMTIAGQAAELRVVRADAEPQAVLDAIAAVWQKESGLIRRHADGPWVNLSRIDRGGLQALQLRASGMGGSEGYLVDWRLAASTSIPSAATSPPTASRTAEVMRILPVGARVISDVASHDPPRGRTVVAWVDADVSQADRQVVARAQAAGLRAVREAGQGDRRPGPEMSHQFSGAGLEYAVTVHEQGRGTALVVHQMEAVR